MIGPDDPQLRRAPIRLVNPRQLFARWVDLWCGG